jgi:uncharacterized protein YkwD
LRSIRTAPAAAAAQFESIGTLLRRHRGITRVSLAAIALTAVFVVSVDEPTSAGPPPAEMVPESLLPENIGIGVASDGPVSIAFDAAMDPASVEAGLQLLPRQPVSLRWNEARTMLELSPSRLWRTDERYLIVLGGEARHADGSRLGVPQRWAFTTQTAPLVTDFQVRLAGVDLMTPAELRAAAADPLLAVEVADLGVPPPLTPTSTSRDVSARTAITVSFSVPMDRADVERRFAIAPAVNGDLAWDDGKLVFRPTERLAAGMRYTVSVVGAQDATGNPVAGKANFSFTVRPGAQLVTTRPGLGEAEVETESIEMWFSHPLDTTAVAAALSVVDRTTGSTVSGETSWNAEGTQLTFVPSAAFEAGHAIDVALGEGSTDVDGNPVTQAWSFLTKAPPPQPAPVTVTRSTTTTRVVVPAAAPAADLQQYALNQINAARGAYGFAPLVLDAQLSAVAYAHASDQAVNGYFSHTSLDGRSRDDRMRGGGIAYSHGGENQCYLVGRSAQATLDWCHAQFMAEPYPGHWNHIGNILDPRFHRVGVGIAQAGSKIVITWDFAD